MIRASKWSINNETSKEIRVKYTRKVVNFITLSGIYFIAFDFETK